MDRLIKQTAADWVSRIETRALSSDEQEALQAWLESDPEHANVFQRMSEIMLATEQLQDDLISSVEPAPQKNRFVQWSYGVSGFLLAACLAVISFMILFPVSSQTIETALGEHRTVELEDGSTMQLNAGTQVSVEYRRNSRRVSIDRGEAVFDVAHNRNRPFYVSAGDLEIKVLGTGFNVANYGRATEVAVLNGKVGVSQKYDAEGVASIVLYADEGVISVGGKFEDKHFVDAARVGSWRDGWLYMENQPLPDLLARIEHQYPVDIVADDPRLSSMNVSVFLQLGHREEFFSTLSTLLPVDIQHDAEYQRVELQYRE